MNLNNNITEAIRNRISVRTYNNENLKEEDINKIKVFIPIIRGPFKPKVRFKILDSKGEINGAKLGTYGVIKGTNIFLGAAVEKGEMDLEQLGYEMESLILYITSLGLGSCWMAGTFNKSQFNKAMDISENEIFPVVSPIGYKDEKKRLSEKIISNRCKSRSRKEWNQIFFLRDTSSPITQFSTLGKLKEVFENVRLAPSAMNKQPWRIIKKEGDFHFYMDIDKKHENNEKDEKNEKDLKVDVHRIDMGIAMCHFDLSCKEAGLEGGFLINNPNIENIPNKFKYIATWRKY